MIPPGAYDSANATPDEGPAVSGLTPAQAHELVAGGRAVLVDTRDRRLFDNAHATGALSVPLATIEAAEGHVPEGSLPPSGRRLTLGSNAMVPTSTADAEPSTGITAPLT